MTLVVKLYLLFVSWRDSLFWVFVKHAEGFPGSTVVKNLPASAEDSTHTSSILGSGRSLGEGNDNPLKYSYLENPWTEETGGFRVAKIWTQLSVHMHVKLTIVLHI